jgi:methionyl-tRNA formyltransferase
MRTVVFAYHNIGIVGLEALSRHGFDIAAVFSHLDDPQENIWFGSVVEWAKKRRIAFFCPENVNTPHWLDKIREFQPEAIFSFYYRNLLGGEILRLPPSGAYNLHGSLLPAYRGRSPVNWVLVNGETLTGVTLHHMVEKADAGDIVEQKEVPIEFEDTALTLYGKICGRAKLLLDEILPLLRDGVAPRRVQDSKRATYFGGRRPEDGKIDWRWQAAQIYNLIRAVTEPYPGAFSFLPDGKMLMVWWADPEPGIASDLPAGTVEIEQEEVYVRAADGRLRLVDIEVGKQRMEGKRIVDYFKNQKGIVLR